MGNASEFRITINKWLIVAGAVACLGASGAIWYFNGEDDSIAKLFDGMLGALTRTGLILAALGFAVPPKRKLRVTWKVFLVAVVALIAIAFRPNVAIPLIAILLAVALFLRPRDKAEKQKKLSRKYRSKTVETEQENAS